MVYEQTNAKHSFQRQAELDIAEPTKSFVSATKCVDMHHQASVMLHDACPGTARHLGRLGSSLGGFAFIFLGFS